MDFFGRGKAFWGYRGQCKVLLNEMSVLVFGSLEFRVSLGLKIGLLQAIWMPMVWTTTCGCAGIQEVCYARAILI